MKEEIDSYLTRDNWRIKENTNQTYSMAGLFHQVAGKAMADYTLNILDKDVSFAHRNHLMHIHDLSGGLSPYCSGWSLRGLIKDGLIAPGNLTNSSPAKHFDTILRHMTQWTFLIANEFSGASAFSDVDTYLAPFIREDKLTYKQVKQALQAFVYELGSAYRSGLQQPFSNITLSLTPPKDMKDNLVVVGGKALDYTYGDCQKEMDMFNKAFTEVMLKGDANGKVFAFPIPTYNITKDFDWNSEVAQGIFELTAKTGIPYFSNFINSTLDPTDVRSLCPLDADEDVLVLSKANKFIRTNIKRLYQSTNREGSKQIYQVLSHGRLVDVKINEFSLTEFIEIVLMNGLKIRTTKNHLNKTLRGDEIRSDELTVDDYLPISNKAFEGLGLTYTDGMLVGAFLGDGSYKDENTVVYSLNKESKIDIYNLIKKEAEINYGAYITENDLTSSLSGKVSCVNLNINSKKFRGLIEDFVTGSDAKTKGIDLKAISMSKEFRQGLIDGLYATDGGNSNRIYTTSSQLKDDILTVFASLGKSCRVDEDTRTIEDGKLGNSIVYCIRFYSENGRGLTGVYVKEEEFNWFKIKALNKYTKNHNAKGYCLEVIGGDEPFFMMPNGILTHNCRLRLDTSELSNGGGGLFGAGELTGSIGVVTINAPRLAFMSHNPNNDKVIEILTELPYTTQKDFFEADTDVKRLKVLYKYTSNMAKKSLVDKRRVVEKYLKHGLFPFTSMVLNDFSNHFNTIGIIGMHEALLNLGIDNGIISKEGKALAEELMDYQLSLLKEYQAEYKDFYKYDGWSKGLLFNFEATPGEGTSYKLALYDKKYFDGECITGLGLDGETPYYTNSTWIPQDDEMNTDIFKILDHQDSLQVKYTSGTVIHFYTEGTLTADKCKDIVYKSCYNYNLPYISISPTISTCPVHGRLDGNYDYCPFDHTEEEIELIIKRGGIVETTEKGENRVQS